MEWSEMGAGERDALVATEVMGYEVREEFFSDGDPAGSLVYDQRGVCIGGPGEGYSPTRSITDAWEVVEKMTEEPRTAFRIAKSYAGTIATYYPLTSAATEAELRASRVSEGIADTAPEAICLAALRAKGVEV